MKKSIKSYILPAISVLILAVIIVIVVIPKTNSSQKDNAETSKEGEFTYTSNKMKFENVYRIDIQYWKQEPPLGLSVTDKEDIESIISRLNSLDAEVTGKDKKKSSGNNMVLQIFTEDREYQYMIDIHSDYIKTGLRKYTSKKDINECLNFLVDYFDANYDESKDFMK